MCTDNVKPVSGGHVVQMWQFDRHRRRIIHALRYSSGIRRISGVIAGASPRCLVIGNVERNSVTRFLGEGDTGRRRRRRRLAHRFHRDRDAISIDLWPHHPSTDSPLPLSELCVRTDPRVDLLSLGYEPPSVEDESEHRARHRRRGPDPGPVHGLRGTRALDAVSSVLR